MAVITKGKQGRPVSGSGLEITGDVCAGIYGGLFRAGHDAEGGMSLAVVRPSMSARLGGSIIYANESPNRKAELLADRPKILVAVDWRL